MVNLTQGNVDAECICRLSFQVVSEEHEQKDWDHSKVKPANLHRADVREVIQSDEKVPIKDVTVWIDPLDATQEYTGK